MWYKFVFLCCVIIKYLASVKFFQTDPDERKQQNQQNYICCVCNVGDTLAYVYSQKYGIRELTKGMLITICR